MDYAWALIVIGALAEFVAWLLTWPRPVRIINLDQE